MHNCTNAERPRSRQQKSGLSARCHQFFTETSPVFHREPGLTLAAGSVHLNKCCLRRQSPSSKPRSMPSGGTSGTMAFSTGKTA